MASAMLVPAEQSERQLVPMSEGYRVDVYHSPFRRRLLYSGVFFEDTFKSWSLHGGLQARLIDPIENKRDEAEFLRNYLFAAEQLQTQSRDVQRVPCPFKHSDGSSGGITILEKYSLRTFAEAYFGGFVPLKRTTFDVLCEVVQ